MDIRTIKNIIKEFNDTDVHKLNIEFEGFKIELEKETKQFITQSAVEAVAIQPQVQQPVHSQPAAVVGNNNNNAEVVSGTQIKAPLVGTYYASPDPESPQFVSVGETVAEGQIVCIIEAMKVMNEIKAPKSGKVKQILVDNESMVEFDQPIMVIE